MGTVFLDDPVNGTLADATLIANNNTALENVLNGNIDTANIATNGVGTTEIQDASVTNAKLAGGITADKLAAGVIPAPGTAPPKYSFSPTPPASPATNDHWYYANGTGGWWVFAYHPGFDPTYPWVYIGGSAGRIYAPGGFNSTQTSVWVKSQDAFCPNFTLPFNGVYSVSWNTTISGNTTGSGSAVYITGLAIAGTDPGLQLAVGWTRNTPGQGLIQNNGVQALAAGPGSTLRVAYWTDAFFSLVSTEVRITPEKVG
jgi:hypothetical protein